MTVAEIIKDFDPISLAEIDQLSLMSRTDTKFIFHERRLPEFLLQITKDYRVLEIKNSRMMPYHSVYFDTPGFYLYLCHHNGKRCRYKVRLRDYLISDVSFFEIKKKTNKERTRKKRMQVPFQTKEFSPETAEFLKKYTNLDHSSLMKTIENDFTRITLAGFKTQERITIDTNMSYALSEKKFTLPGLVITEVKRSAESGKSPALTALKNLRIYPSGFSKYCIGMVSIIEGIKYNNFKPKLMTLKKIMQ